MRRSEQIRRQEQRRRRVRIMVIILAVAAVCVLLAVGIFVFRGINEREKPVTTSIVVNKDSLQELIEQLKQVDRSQYMPASLSTLDQRLQEAQAVIDNNESEEKLDSAYMNLIIALQGLVPNGD